MSAPEATPHSVAPPGATGRQPAVQRLQFQLSRGARKLAYRALARGDKTQAQRIVSLALSVFPGHPFVLRLNAQVALTAPIDLADVHRALDRLEPHLATDNSCRAKYLELIHAAAANGGEPAELAGRLEPLVTLPGRSGIGAVRSLLDRASSWGHVELVEAAATALIDLRPADDAVSARGLASLAQRAALLSGNLDFAARTTATVSEWSEVNDDDRALMTAALSLAVGRAGEATAVLERMRPHRPVDYSRHLVESYLARGRHDLVLGYLDSVSHELPVNDALVLRYDALVALDRVAEADALAATIDPEQLSDPNLFRVFREHCGRDPAKSDAAVIAAVGALESGGDLDDRRAAALTSCYLELGLFEEVERIANVATARDESLLNPWARLNVAKARYSARRFGDATAMLDTMIGNGNRWDAEKLRARILLERGDTAGALANRVRHRGSGGDIDDEVLYHALLHQRRFAEAFAVHLSARDRQRLRAVFGDRAEFGPEFPYVDRRFIVSQAGPGDEIGVASTYATLAESCDELFVACDPRLETLFARSLPMITFVPVERLRAATPGMLAPDRPRRADSVLYDLLTAEAMELAAGCDRVALGRSLGQLTVGEKGAPYDRYLHPRQDLTTRFGGDDRGCRVGIVWRSEAGGPMRGIHYLGVGDLRPLLSRPEHFVNLQYNATAGERAALDAMSALPVEQHDEFDMRNDFETTAALLHSLDAVVGIGTTMVELSGAVGTPTVMLQPTHFGTWRAMDAAGSDYWHRSVRVAALEQPWWRDLLVAAACEMLDEVPGEGTAGRPTRPDPRSGS